MIFPFNVKVKSMSGAEIIIGVEGENPKDAIAKATYHQDVIQGMNDAYYFEVLLNIPSVQPIAEST